MAKQTGRSRLTRVGGWCLAGLTFGGVAWLWWQAGQPATHERPSSPPASPSTPKVNQAPATTNRVVQAEPPLRREPAVVSNAAPPLVAPSPPANVTTNPVPVTAETLPRPVRNVLEAQVALARLAISPGSVDGAIGTQTRAALRAFQRQEQLPITGILDAATKDKLLLDAPIFTNYTVTPEDLARLQPLSATWLGKSQQTALEYETLLERVAEIAHAHPNLIRQLNPGLDWPRAAAGTSVELVDAEYPDPPGKAAWITIRLGEKTLEAYDAETNLLAHFPCSIAARVEKRPVGDLAVAVLAPHPNYTFNPEVFPESAEAHELQRKLILPPGPNNPVGVAWIGLDKPGYGIHGTPTPEQVGRTESHGCFRLANWDAEYLLRLVVVGTPVKVEL